MKKILLIFLAIALSLSIGGCQTEEIPVTQITTDLAPLCATQTSFLDNNPDRGWRLEAFINVANSSGDGMGAQEHPEQVLTLALDRYKKYDPQLCQVYFYLTGYKNIETIPQEGFDRMQRVFDAARERGIKLLVRFSYETDMEGTGEASDEIMLAHMKQLRPLLEKNIELIHTVEAGFLGAWGEWHSYKMEHDELTLLKGILDMVPQELYVQVRYAPVKNYLKYDTPDDPNLERMGYHDDSFFGWQDVPWHACPYDDNWEQMRKESDNAPQGGEMFWGCQYDLNYYPPTTGALAIRKFDAFHQTSFSLYHSFIEQPFTSWAQEGAGYYSIQDWLTEPITEQWLDKNHVAYDPAWFRDEAGDVVERTAFEFVHDHLGYRIRATQVTSEGKRATGETLQVSLKLKNDGFSAAFNMSSGFALLDEDGTVVATTAAGDPSTWISDRDKEFTISAQMQLPSKAGRYVLVFYLRNSAGTGARLANDLRYINGYTVLQSFDIV